MVTMPGSDITDLQNLVDTFFAAFTSGDGVAGRMQALRDVMLPGARIVRTCGDEPLAYGVEEFLTPRARMLDDGTLTDFHEHAGSGRLDVFGDVAAWFGAYTKDGVLRGEPCPGDGMKSIQFVRTAAGWRIAAAAWDDVRPGLAAGDHVVRQGD